MPSMDETMQSPGCRYTGGLREYPTPSGVPVRMTVPGSSVVPGSAGNGCNGATRCARGERHAGGTAPATGGTMAEAWCDGRGLMR